METKPYILFVDDDPIVIGLLIQEFKAKFGNAFTYEKAQHPLEAEEIIDEEYQSRGVLPALIISDWSMPHKSGSDFLVQLHAQFPQVPLILCSGLADKAIIDDIEKHAKLLCSLSKPWDGKQGILEIEQVLQS